MQEQLHYAGELDELKSVWVKKRRDNELLIGGHINFFTVLELRKETQQWLDRLRKSYTTIVINLESGKPIGTVCVSYMLCLVRFANKLKLDITFINVPDELLRILHLSGMTDVLQIDRSRGNKRK